MPPISTAERPAGAAPNRFTARVLVQRYEGGKVVVLFDDVGWDKAALQAKIKEGARYDINLTKAVPVIWVYLTGWSNGDGPANFRDDVYNVDNVGGAQVSAQAAPVR